MLLALYAVMIFVVFAVVGGAIVWFIVQNQSDDDTRGRPQDRN